VQRNAGFGALIVSSDPLFFIARKRLVILGASYPYRQSLPIANKPKPAV